MALGKNLKPGDLASLAGIAYVVILRDDAAVFSASPEGHKYWFYDDDRVERSRRKPWSVSRATTRSDGIKGYFAVSPDAKQVIIKAGCKTFLSIADARNHWEVVRVPNSDWDKREAKRRRGLNEESLEWLNKCERRLKRLQAALKRKPKTAKVKRPAAAVIKRGASPERSLNGPGHWAV